MVCAVIAAFLYLKITVAMYMADGTADDRAADEAVADEAVAEPPARVPVPFGARLALGVAFLVTVVVGFFPGPVAEVSRDAQPSVTATE
jgi:NADH:ubiquinone oxidoreductase subunit 2 (subunit N)